MRGRRSFANATDLVYLWAARRGGRGPVVTLDEGLLKYHGVVCDVTRPQHVRFGFVTRCSERQSTSRHTPSQKRRKQHLWMLTAQVYTPCICTCRTRRGQLSLSVAAERAELASLSCAARRMRSTSLFSLGPLGELGPLDHPGCAAGPRLPRRACGGGVQRLPHRRRGANITIDYSPKNPAAGEDGDSAGADPVRQHQRRGHLSPHRNRSALPHQRSRHQAHRRAPARPRRAEAGERRCRPLRRAVDRAGRAGRGRRPGVGPRGQRRQRPRGDGASSADTAFVYGCAGATYYLDRDGDGYGDSSVPRVDCARPADHAPSTPAAGIATTTASTSIPIRKKPATRSTTTATDRSTRSSRSARSMKTPTATAMARSSARRSRRSAPRGVRAELQRLQRQVP